ncbi:sensor histidine kinase [Actinomadura craniellae]|uniref:sensor histidine kinase n=1 Tax=Actinomadura craniellae TaxID=2231787 RepID=UPI001313F398|nr:HAMP domain-containing sensor histidine kinase [Actinomadura craniellae]
MNWKRSSLRTGSTLIAAVIAALVSISISLLFLLQVAAEREDRDAARADAAIDRVFFMIRKDRLPPELSNRQDETMVQVVDSRGRVVSASESLAGRPPMATFVPPPGQRVRIERTLCPPNGLTGCMDVKATAVTDRMSPAPQNHMIIYTATPHHPWYGSLGMLLLAGAASTMATALASAGIYWMVTKTLAPMNAIRTELAEITATNLDRRVPVPKHQELRLMAETVNATLDRLQNAVDQLRRFTSEASHDLRSPITAMRTHLEEALLYPEDTDWPRLTTEVLSGVERQQAIVTDLLTLSRLDSGLPLYREPTDLARLVEAELGRRPPARVGIVRKLGEGVIVDCDRLRITRLLTNLLDNAERHATGQITVTVRFQDSSAVLEVADDGEGVPPEHREKIFERFTRLEASRSRDPAGTGLGLPICRDIAKAHHGTLALEDSDHGARFVLYLPRAGHFPQEPECAPEPHDPATLR